MRLSPGPPGMTLRAIRRNWSLGELPRSPQAQDRRELGDFCHHQHHDFLLMLPKQAAVLRVMLPETPVNLECSLPVKSSPRALFLHPSSFPKHVRANPMEETEFVFRILAPRKSRNWRFSLSVLHSTGELTRRKGLIWVSNCLSDPPTSE